MTNQQIYKYAQNLAIFNSCNIKMPVRINFYLQKNIQLIQQRAAEIEQARLDIGAHFGSLNTEGTGYDIPVTHIDEANHELNDLFNLEQDIPLHIFKLSDFDGIELTYQQMSAIMFMVEED
jgi:hypothetical protein